GMDDLPTGHAQSMGPRRLVVLLVTIYPMDIRPHWRTEGIHTVATTWEKICAMRSHPKSDEIMRYFRWKLGHTREYLVERLRQEEEGFPIPPDEMELLSQSGKEK
ncbi:MAG: hypothetical protein QUS11_02100, partial [Candidatus Fermentibacter sp.]|nr:hypothetical protein [Candidatus Fermentibacter sp.]